MRRASVWLVTTALASASCKMARMPAPADSGRTAESEAESDTTARPALASHFVGLRTAKYAARDLADAKAWYSKVLGGAPYFDSPQYVGFDVGGFELGIVPDSTATRLRPEAGVAYWGVGNADSAFARLIDLGAIPYESVFDAGGGVRIGAVRDPFGNILGVVQNPSFKLRQ